MLPTDLERTLVEKMLADVTLEPAKRSVQWDAVNVRDRSFTGAGFMTEFDCSAELKLFPVEVSLRWGNVGARINASRIETGYLVYVDGGQITAVEGYTYGDEWPSTIDSVEWYELKEGAELENPPKVRKPNQG